MSLPAGLPSYEFLRSLQPSTDLPGYYHLRIRKQADGRLPLLAPDGIPAFTPISMEAFFGKPGPIEIEIGCGKGGFLVEYCEKHPDFPVVGLEWEPEIACLAARRLVKRPHIPHARVLLGDAFYFFRDFLPESGVRAFHMYFPDPWPKKRHHKNRLMAHPFMAQVLRTALPDAPFYWGTDHQEYNAEAQELFASLPWLEMVEPNAEPTEGIMTNFEKKYRKQGKPIYRCVMRVRKDL
ncbi:MAG: tRNA ((7)-)-methyltransferase [Fibrobacteres bacterium]|nr:tRNA ((7)-)-methyltransferase [Fibrobacterota bacterium]